MITLRDLRELQDALTSVLAQGVFLRQALRSYLKDRRLTRTERGWARDFLHRSVQLKNRYWTAAEAFIKESPEREDQPLDLRYFFLYHYFHQKEHSPTDEAVYRLLEVKSRVRKFRRFLHETKQETIFPKTAPEDPVFLWRYHSHPLWMIRKWLAVYPYQEVIRFCQFNNSSRTSAHDPLSKTTRSNSGVVACRLAIWIRRISSDWVKYPSREGM